MKNRVGSLALAAFMSVTPENLRKPHTANNKTEIFCATDKTKENTHILVYTHVRFTKGQDEGTERGSPPPPPPLPPLPSPCRRLSTARRYFRGKAPNTSTRKSHQIPTQIPPEQWRVGLPPSLVPAGLHSFHSGINPATIIEMLSTRAPSLL